MKIGITGYSGFVGRELLEFPNTYPISGDVKDQKEIESYILSLHPDIIIHLAAKSNVDYCELPANEHEVRQVNVHGTFNVASAGYKINCPVILLSTDHVFSGMWGNYKENNTPKPVNFYGLSKLAAETLQEAFPNLKIVRTSHLFSNNYHFANEMSGLVRGEVQEYALFMSRSFMWVTHFAKALMEYVHRIDVMPSILHISGAQSISHFAFMKAVAETFGISSKLVMPRIKEISGHAPRPYLAGLNVSMSRKLGISQFDYLDGLRKMEPLG